MMIATAVLLGAGAVATAAGPDAGPAAAASLPFDALAATERYLATMSPESRARSDAYFECGYWLSLWNALLALGVAWLLLGTRLAARLRDRVERLTRFRPLQAALYAVAYLGLAALLTLPWDAYQGYFREHQYGMSNQGLAAWLGDEGKSLAIGLVFGGLGAMAIYAVLHRAVRSWWRWGSLVALLLVVVQLVIGPTYLEPVFNRFYPLVEGPVKERILSLARANGIPATQVYKYDASRQTTKPSAHVSGLFGTARISLNDNLMTRASPEEIEAVLGHEIGHYVLNHVYTGVLYVGLIIVAGFAFLNFAYGRVLAGLGRGWGISATSATSPGCRCSWRCSASTSSC